MLTFELRPDGDEIELHGDREGFLELAQALMDLATKGEIDHEHFMTEDWGGGRLSNVRQGLDNRLVHHVKVMFWPE